MTAKRIRAIVIMAALIIMSVSPFVVSVDAAELQDRSLAVSSSVPSEVTDHLFNFSYPGASSVGSVAFEYCANTAVLGSVCTAPTGFDGSVANVAFQGGETGFNLHPSTTANRIVISRASAVTTPGTAQYLFENVVNHSQASKAVYVRIYTYASDDGTGGYTDAGAVAFSTASQITVGAYVPPYLLFCVGITVSLDCSAASGNSIQLNELESTLPSVATSQYSGATNDFTGYSVSVYGTTMTSGNNIIPALSSAAAASTGVSQFGINLRDNGLPDVGIEPIGPGTASARAGYNAPNVYKFNSGDLLSSTNISSNYDRFTVSYLVNVDNDQPAGIYSTTLTYIAVAAF